MINTIEEAYRQAVGLASTLEPHMQIDVRDPLGMMEQVVAGVREDRAELEQLRVQLAGCLTAAEGGTSDGVVVKQGQYGWSLAYAQVLALRRKCDELEAICVESLAAGAEAKAFIAVMVGEGDDAAIPETFYTPLGLPIKIGAIMRDIRAAISKATVSRVIEGD